LDLAGFDPAVWALFEVKRLVRPDRSNIDLAIGQDHENARADPCRDDADRRGA
jgi:hypothetical protein